jgi:hypothetical protein
MKNALQPISRHRASNDLASILLEKKKLPDKGTNKLSFLREIRGFKKIVTQKAT